MCQVNKDDDSTLEVDKEVGSRAGDMLEVDEEDDVAQTPTVPCVV